jgi:hypothetical protein
MSALRDRSDWELRVRAVVLRSGEVFPENDAAGRLCDLIDECWHRRLHSSETVGRIIELCRLGSRKAWENEVDRGMREVMSIGVEEAWPEVLDRGWEAHQPPGEAARDLCRMLHEKYGLDYTADALDPWHPGGGPPR